MRLAPEGAGIIAASAALVLVAVVASLLVDGGRLLFLPALAVLWFLAVVQFFRDPERVPPRGSELILSPADGKIISVGPAPRSPLDPPGKRVSIFMSPINVHVNRAPAAGKVVSVEHFDGKFLSAFKEEASRENERTMIAMETASGRIAFSQIAGFLARRIVFHPKPGDSLNSGERVGMIKFGSRVDLHLPDNVAIRVAVGDRVAAGETVIGVFKDAQ
ncbi:MAG: phosphatidylserine decarboxylase family protein [Calditrichaeota bacterium]|nr:phosphatidylserine decarboxylase family protein [Calditrichota bacterium]